MTCRQAKITLPAFLGALFLPVLSGQTAPAWATQEHGGAEGMVIHQLGHVLFVIGMLYPLYRISLQKPAEPGWGFFKGFLRTICLWNLIAFAGHWLGEKILPEQYLREGGVITGLRINSLADAIFYLTKLEHLVLAPAFLLLFLALHRWNRQT